MNKRKITVLDGIKTWPVNISHVDEIRKIARNKIKTLNKVSLYEFRNSFNGLNNLNVSILLMVSYYITNNIFFNDKFYLNEN